VTTEAPPSNGWPVKPPQSEVTHTGLMESVIIPWRRAMRTCAGAFLGWAFVYAVWACVWMGLNVKTYHRHWWEPWVKLVTTIGRIWPWLVIPWLLSCVAVWAAHYVGNIVQVLNEKFWPVLTAVDPGEYGLLGILTGRRRGRDEPADTDEAEADTLPRDWHVRIQLESPNRAQRRYVEFDIERDYGDQWRRYCEALANQRGFLAPRFSRAGARRFGLPWDVFRPIQREFLARGLAAQEASSNNSGRVALNARGRAVCRAFATTPPPNF